MEKFYRLEVGKRHEWRHVGNFPDAEAAKIFGFLNYRSKDIQIIDSTGRFCYKICNYINHVEISSYIDRRYCSKKVYCVENSLIIEPLTEFQDPMADVCDLAKNHILSYVQNKNIFPWRKVGF